MNAISPPATNNREVQLNAANLSILLLSNLIFNKVDEQSRFVIVVKKSVPEPKGDDKKVASLFNF